MIAAHARPVEIDEWPLRLMTPREVAERLRVSTRTVQNWIREGRLPATRVSPRVVRIPADAVEALVRRCRGSM